MRYYSRRLSDEVVNYLVMDTDTGMEERHSKLPIGVLCGYSFVEGIGLVVRNTTYSCDMVIGRVYPYVPDTATNMKIFMLSGIRSNVIDGDLYSIVIDSKCPRRLKFSDFCNTLKSCCVHIMVFEELEFVIDNRIKKVEDKCFGCLNGSRVKIKILSDVVDDSVLVNLMLNYASYCVWEDKSRYKLYSAESAFLNSDFYYSGEVDSEVLSFIEKRHKAEILSRINNTPIVVNYEKSYSYNVDLLEDIDLSNVDCVLKELFTLELFVYGRTSEMLTFVGTYLEMGGRDEGIVKAFMEYINNTVDKIRSLYEVYK